MVKGREIGREITDEGVIGEVEVVKGVQNRKWFDGYSVHITVREVKVG